MIKKLRMFRASCDIRYLKPRQTTCDIVITHVKIKKGKRQVTRGTLSEALCSSLPRQAIAVGPPGPTGFDETSRILL
jgi:hypothetical protein